MKTTKNVEQFPHNEEIDFSKRLNAKFGIDPTSDRLHLGHLVPLLLVRQLKDDGHRIDIVLGSFSASLGDPSGKDNMRPMLDMETTIKNAESILRQVERVLGADINVHHNHTWFEAMSAVEMMNLVAKFSVNNLLSRDSFQRRVEAGSGIGMHELLVPILQGFDSVKLETDLEVGGSDQLFNFSITRDLQRAVGQRPESCLMTGIINGTDGRKMSKSLGNCIFLDDEPDDVFGKVMSISDALMREWFPVFMDGDMGRDLMSEKKRLAHRITTAVWSERDADEALNQFEEVIQNRKLPDNIVEISDTDVIGAVRSLRKCSATEARRLLSQGAVSVNGEKVNTDGPLKLGDVIRAGKLHFGRIA